MSATKRSDKKIIPEDFQIWEAAAEKPRRLKLTGGTDGLKLKYRGNIETMFLKGQPVMHMINQGTH